ncbi:MAG TPA: hypothetical protein VF606_01200, partial [Geminicoccaceae bacterium]
MATSGIHQRFSIPTPASTSGSRSASPSSGSESPRASLAPTAAPPPTAPSTSALAGVVRPAGPRALTAADRLPATSDLGGKGRSFNAIKNKLREVLFGASAERKGTAPHGTAGRTVQQHNARQITNMANADAISLTNAKGHRLDGHFFSPRTSGTKGLPDLTKPVVLLLTGSGGCAEEQGMGIAAEHSLRHDVNVMSVNYRGYGTSQGKPTEKGLYQDAQAMYGELLNMGFRPENIVVHGFSMGAAVAAQLHSACDQAGVQLKGVVYDRPMTSTKDAA